MKKLQFLSSLSAGRFNIDVPCSVMFQSSLVDPYQYQSVGDIVRALDNGENVNVSTSPAIFNGLKVDNLSVIERQGSDQFDVFAESKKLTKSINQQIKNVQKNEKDSSKVQEN